jgi:hypothetical protein
MRFAPVKMVRLVVARLEGNLGDASWLETSEQRTGATLLSRVAFRNIFIFLPAEVSGFLLGSLA